MMSLRYVRRGIATSKFWNTLATLAGVGAFVQQTTSSDVSYGQSYLNSLSGTDKAKAILGWTVSRVTFGNVVLFPKVVGAVQPTFQIGNVVNKWTGLGVAAIIYKHIAGLPHRGKVGKFGFPLLAGGILGGLFDDPSDQAISRSPAYSSPQVVRALTSTKVNAH